MTYYDKLVKQIKKRIPKGKKVYLDGGCQTDERYYLWWYIHKEGKTLWLEYETDDCPYGRMAQQAEDVCTADMLESVLQSMTETTVPDMFPVGATRY